MLHGKKAFERIVWAFKNVLNHSVTWLFHDIGKNSGGMFSYRLCGYWRVSAKRSLEMDPMSKHHPEKKSAVAEERRSKGVLLPGLDPSEALNSRDNLEDWAVGTLEWLSLVAMQSPRVMSADIIDTYLSRYQVPEGGADNSCPMVIISWKGLLPAVWIRSLFIELK